MARPDATAPHPDAGWVPVGPFRVLAADQATVVRRIAALAGGDGPRTALALHVGALNHRADAEFVAVTRRADLVYADGMAVVVLARLAGAAAIERAGVTDIGVPVLREVGRRLGRPLRLGLVGGAAGLAEQAATVLTEQTGCEVVHVSHGYAADWAPVLAALRAAAPDVLVVGFGTPPEMFWIDRYRAELPAALVLNCGGWFGFLTAREQRAPAWMQRWGLEWAFRVSQDPRRLWRRYATGLMSVLSLVPEALRARRARALP